MASSWLCKRGSDSQGRLCPVVRSWELATFFIFYGVKIMIQAILLGILVYALLVIVD